MRRTRPRPMVGPDKDCMMLPHLRYILLGLLCAIAVSAQARCRILVYGDSNTYGWQPVADGERRPRYGDDERWAGVMAKALGPEYTVVVNGLIGRTLNVDLSEGVGQLSGEDENGSKHLALALTETGPFDLVILALGTNDLMDELKRSPEAIAADLKISADIVARAIEPASAPLGRRLLVLAPPPMADTSRTGFKDLFSAAAVAKSRHLAAAYAEEGKRLGIPVFAAGKVIVSDGIDGLHWSAAMHRKLGEAMAARVRRLLAESPRRAFGPGVLRDLTQARQLLHFHHGAPSAHWERRHEDAAEMVHGDRDYRPGMEFIGLHGLSVGCHADP